MRESVILMAVWGMIIGCQGQNLPSFSNKDLQLRDPLECVDSGGVYFGAIQCGQAKDDYFTIPMAECNEGQNTFELIWKDPNRSLKEKESVDVVQEKFNLARNQNFRSWRVYCLIIPMREVEDEHEDINITFPCAYSFWTSQGGETWEHVASGNLIDYKEYCALKLSIFEKD
ncbi:MAG: hypothetical protein ACK5W1_02070 [Flavobacteriales bacterium]|jgi:hypothetical protein